MQVGALALPGGNYRNVDLGGAYPPAPNQLDLHQLAPGVPDFRLDGSPINGRVIHFDHLPDCCFIITMANGQQHRVPARALRLIGVDGTHIRLR